MQWVSWLFLISLFESVTLWNFYGQAISHLLNFIYFVIILFLTAIVNHKSDAENLHFAEIKSSFAGQMKRHPQYPEDPFNRKCKSKYSYGLNRERLLKMLSLRLSRFLNTHTNFILIDSKIFLLEIYKQNKYQFVYKSNVFDVVEMQRPLEIGLKSCY